MSNLASCFSLSFVNCRYHHANCPAPSAPIFGACSRFSQRAGASQRLLSFCGFADFISSSLALSWIIISFVSVVVTTITIMMVISPSSPSSSLWFHECQCCCLLVAESRVERGAKRWQSVFTKSFSPTHHHHCHVLFDANISKLYFIICWCFFF